jgi:hypothetical protein
MEISLKSESTPHCVGCAIQNSCHPGFVGHFCAAELGADSCPVRINVNRGLCMPVQQIAHTQTQIFIENPAQKLEYCNAAN